MANYRIAQDAKADLRRIYRTGFDRWGEATADKCYPSLFGGLDFPDASKYVPHQFLVRNKHEN